MLKIHFYDQINRNAPTDLKERRDRKWVVGVNHVGVMIIIQYVASKQQQKGLK